MQRSNSWLSALATAVGRAIGVIDSGPILPVTTPPSSLGSINGSASESVGFAPDRLPAGGPRPFVVYPRVPYTSSAAARSTRYWKSKFWML